MEKEVVWTDRAKEDLQKIYEFNIKVVGENSAFSIITKILEKTDLLHNNLIGGTRYISIINSGIYYQKLIHRNYLVIFREERNKVYINRIFDARQDPEKIGI